MSVPERCATRAIRSRPPARGDRGAAWLRCRAGWLRGWGGEQPAGYGRPPCEPGQGRFRRALTLLRVRVRHGRFSRPWRGHLAAGTCSTSPDRLRSSRPSPLALHALHRSAACPTHSLAPNESVPYATGRAKQVVPPRPHLHLVATASMPVGPPSGPPSTRSCGGCASLATGAETSGAGATRGTFERQDGAARAASGSPRQRLHTSMCPALEEVPAVVLEVGKPRGTMT